MDRRSNGGNLFSVPAGTRYFRLDLGNVPGMFQISEVALVYGDVREELDLTDLTEQQNQVEVRAAGGRAVQVDTLEKIPISYLPRIPDGLTRHLPRAADRWIWC